MKNEKICVLIIIVMIFMIQNVKADNSCYYSKDLINLTEKEYNYVIQFYGEDFLNSITIDDYYWLLEMDLNNNDYEINVINSPSFIFSGISPKGTIVTSNEKQVAISKTCLTNYCSITVLVTWLNQPNVKSYDVIGARLWNTSLYNNSITTLIRTSSGTTTQSNYLNYTDGFGNSVLLPSSGVISSVEQRFKVNKSGTVYASYQHAISNVTLSTSKLYTISSSGYGGVFSFYGNAIGKYDNTTGVSI